jgi:hypothetical protein
MLVRLVVRVTERASVRQFVHATRHEPVVVDAAQGIVSFDVPYRRVEAVLNRLAKSGVPRFEAHLTPKPKAHDSAGQA